MKTSRQDVIRDNKEIFTPNSITIGYSTNRLKNGDLFIYTEKYTDGTFGRCLAKCHGRIKPLYKLEGDKEDIIQWYILAQVSNDLMTFTFERWIKPEQVIEIMPKGKGNKHIELFFEEKDI